MVRHPGFPTLVGHDDAELGRLLGAPVVTREDVHVWPLSWVQRVELADGRTYAYKTQRPPTVEPAFYRTARSPLLPAVRDLGPLDGCETLAVEWVDAPRLADLTTDPSDLVRHGRAVVAAIGSLDARLPTYLDIGDRTAWLDLAGETTDRLAYLAGTRFPQIEPRAADEVWDWALRTDVLARIEEDARVTHGDLTAAQIFVTDDGYRVIDWQRPVRGPSDVDLVALLVDADADPYRYLDQAVVGIFWLLRLHWAVLAAMELLPTLPGRLFEFWSQTAIAHLRAAA